MNAVDVLLSTYNGERYVAEAIGSILAQSHRDFTLYIVDDCSRDATWEIVSRFGDPRIVRTRNATNAGLFQNLNTLIARSTAPWIKLIGQDDVLLPACLERSLAFARQHPRLGLLWCYNAFIDADGRVTGRLPEDHATGVLGTAEADRDCLEWGCLSSNIANLLISRAALQDVGAFRTDIMAADFDMMARIQGRFDVARFTELLVHVRSHDGQWSSDIKQMENHLAGNIEVFAQILKRAVEENRSLTRQQAMRLLSARLARNELNWVLKALQTNRDPAAAWRSLLLISRVTPLPSVAADWCRLMLPRYARRVLSGSRAAPAAETGSAA